MDEEYEIDPELQQMYAVIQRMYTSISHGDARYFNMLIKQLSNDSFSDLILDETIMEAMESTFVHILNTMQLVSEISMKINATPMQINTMNNALFMILKSMVKFLKDSQLNAFIVDNSSSFVNLLFCEGVSLSLQFRLIHTLKYLLIPSVMNNTEQWYCFDSYRNILNQTYFHLAAKSRTSGFVRLFFNIPASLPVMKYLHINNRGLIKSISRNNPIINQELVKKRVSDIDVLIILKHAFKLNVPNEWYLRKDINRKSAFDLWMNRAPFYLRFVYYHSVISKLFSSHHQHLSVENNTCISMPYVATYWPTIQWFPIPIDTPITINKDRSVLEVKDAAEFDHIFPSKWAEQQPLVYRQGIYEPWNLSEFQWTELNDIFDDDVFITSNIPYEDLYDNEYIDEQTAAKDREKRSITFGDFTNRYFDGFDGSQSANTLDAKCDEVRKMNKKARETKNKKMGMDVPYIFDNSVYLKNTQFAERFNVSKLIPKYIYEEMQTMIDEYEGKLEGDEEFAEELELNEVVDSIVLLKQLAIGGVFTGAQPHFHGPVFNALVMGKKEWIIFPPRKAFQMKQLAIGGVFTGAQPHFHGPVFNALVMGKKEWIIFPPRKAFQMKQTALQFFCYHENLSKEKKETLMYYTITQNVGDVVFIPSEWAHAVLNVEPSIAVAIELFI
eukprot:1044642_1